MESSSPPAKKSSGPWKHTCIIALLSAYVPLTQAQNRSVASSVFHTDRSARSRGYATPGVAIKSPSRYEKGTHLRKQSMIPGRPPEIVGLVDKLSPGFPGALRAFAFHESRMESQAGNTPRISHVLSLPGISFSLIQCSKNARGVTSTYDFMPTRGTFPRYSGNIGFPPGLDIRFTV